MKRCCYLFIYLLIRCSILDQITPSRRRPILSLTPAQVAREVRCEDIVWFYSDVLQLYVFVPRSLYDLHCTETLNIE